MCVIMLTRAILNDILLNVILLSVDMLSVVAPPIDIIHNQNGALQYEAS